MLSETLEQIACKSPSSFSPMKKFSAFGVSGKFDLQIIKLQALSNASPANDCVPK